MILPSSESDIPTSVSERETDRQADRQTETKTESQRATETERQ